MDIEHQIEEVKNKYPSLTFVEGEHSFIGTIMVDEEDNDEYQVRIDISNFPNRFPNVTEIGERIRKVPNRHIYSDSKTCCFTTPAYEQILLKTEIKTLLDFIDQILVKYLQNNSFYEINGYYKNGEYAHGAIGILQAYKDILNLPDEKILYALWLRTKHKKFGRTESCCFCGQKKIRTCHLQCFNKLYLIDDGTIHSDADKISHLLQANNNSSFSS